MDQECDSMVEQGVSNCKTLVKEYGVLLARFEDEFRSISLHRKGKREAAVAVASALGIGIGALATYFFSSGSDSDLESAVAALKGNQESLESLMRNRTSLVESSLDILAENEDRMAEQIKNLGNNLTKFDSMVVENAMSVRFGENSVLFLTRISDLMEEQRAIVGLLRESGRLRMSGRILRFETFMKEVGRVENYTDLVVPDVDLRELYLNSKISLRVTRNLMVFEVLVPLVIQENFKLFDMSPIPFSVNEEYFDLSLDGRYLIVDETKNVHQLVNNLDNCKMYEKVNVCKITQLRTTPGCAVRMLKQQKEDRCIIRRASEDDFWKPLHGPNRWLFTLRGNETVHLSCGARRMLTVMNVSQGLMTVGGNCDVLVGGRLIVHYEVDSFYVQNAFVAQVNWTFLDDDDLHLLHSAQMHMATLKNVTDLLVKLKETNVFSLKNVIIHPAAHLTLWAIVMTIVSLLLIRQLIKCCCSGREGRNDTSKVVVVNTMPCTAENGFSDLESGQMGVEGRTIGQNTRTETVTTMAEGPLTRIKSLRPPRCRNMTANTTVPPLTEQSFPPAHAISRPPLQSSTIMSTFQPAESSISTVQLGT
jgi:hypothetical protein